MSTVQVAILNGIFSSFFSHIIGCGTTLVTYLIVSTSRYIARFRDWITVSDTVRNGPFPYHIYESGVITSVAQLVQSIMYKLAITAFPLISGLVVIRLHLSIDIMLIYPITQRIRRQSSLCVCRDGRVAYNVQ